MKKVFKSLSFAFLILLTGSSLLFSQNYDIDYYGIVSTNIDANMSKMTSDLYYIQLSEINNFNVSDKRTAVSLEAKPDYSTFSEDKISFFTEITKNEKTDKWLTTIHVVDKSTSQEHILTKEYDSFYKILMESKLSLQENLKDLIENKNTVKKSDEIKNPPKQTEITSTEVLSGTWTGEDYIDKIVILRGGRGFVIFKNGASMNITISLKENDNGIQKVFIKQNSRSNASYFPELPRSTALSAAVNAEPIEWILDISNNDTLTGTKYTLLPNDDTYKNGSLKVILKRVN